MRHYRPACGNPRQLTSEAPATPGAPPYGLAGSLCSFVGAYLAVRFLVRYFETRTLTPFAVYCTLAGLGSLTYLSLT